MRKAYHVIMILYLILNTGSFSFASDAENSESSTAQTYYDYTLNRQQQQVDNLIKFKEQIGGTVANLKEDIDKPKSEVKIGQRKYANTKESVVLGSLYGTKGKLGLSKKGVNAPGGITGVTDTQMVSEINPDDLIGKNKTTIEHPCTMVAECHQECHQECQEGCHQECRQQGYGQVCTQVCTPVCTPVCTQVCTKACTPVCTQVCTQACN